MDEKRCIFKKKKSRHFRTSRIHFGRFKTLLNIFQARTPLYTQFTLENNSVLEHFHLEMVITNENNVNFEAITFYLVILLKKLTDNTKFRLQITHLPRFLVFARHDYEFGRL